MMEVAHNRAFLVLSLTVEYSGEAGEPDTQTIPRGPFLEAEALLSVVDGPRALLDKGDTARETIQCDDPRRLATVERLVVSWESLPAPDQGNTEIAIREFIRVW